MMNESVSNLFAQEKAKLITFFRLSHVHFDKVS